MRKLKEQPGKDILLSGSAQLFNTLMDTNLADLYRIMLFPVVLGKGRRLFAKETDQRVLGVPETKTFSSGVVILEYRPKPAKS